jgi:hypothetical protein
VYEIVVGRQVREKGGILISEEGSDDPRKKDKR